MDVNVMLYDMPGGIRGFTRLNDDGSYTIVLNSRLNHEENKNSFIHEMKHIANGDFEAEKDIDQIEKEYHGA